MEVRKSKTHLNGSVQDDGIFSALAIEIPQTCIVFIFFTHLKFLMIFMLPLEYNFIIQFHQIKNVI